MLPDYYRTLGVEPASSQQQIRAAYLRMVKQCHPDAGGSAQEFRAVRQAYETLGDPARRYAYDQQRGLPRRRTPLEPLAPRRPGEPLRAARRYASPRIEWFDEVFADLDEFFERLEQQFLRDLWGRNE